MIRSLAASLVLLLVGAASALGQAGSIRGFVLDDATGQALPGVNIALRADDRLIGGTVTDREGFFLIARVPAGTYMLEASFVGFDRVRREIILLPNEIRTIRVELTSGAQSLEEIVVESRHESGAARVTAGVQSIRPADIKMIPAPDISGDLAAYLSAMPGVVSTGDRGGQLFIRGGEPTTTLTLLDGIPVLQPFHILGFYSAFASDLIDNADVHAGGFASRYSGRIGSVIDVQSRDGNNRTHKRSISFSPFVNHAMLEGPIVKRKASFLTSIRQSVIDRAAAKYVGAPLPFAFGDLFGKVHAVLSDNHQISATVLRTYDRGSTADRELVYSSEEVRWNNTAVGIRYVILPATLPMFGEVVAFASFLNTQYGPRVEPTRRSSVEDIGGSVNITAYSPAVTTNWGFFLRHIDLHAELGGLYQNLQSSVSRSTNAGAYVEPDFSVLPNLSVRPGLSFRYFGVNGASFEPRLRMLFTHEPHTFSAAAGIYRQEVIGLNDRRDVTNIFTAWTKTPLGDLQRATQVLMGYRIEPARGIEISAEAYHTRLADLSVSEWTAYPRFTTRLQPASGRIYGLDLRLEFRRSTLYAFVNYGLSSVEYEALDQGLRYRPPHDRRHQVNALGRYTVGAVDLSARWQFGSGLPFTQVRGFDAFVYMDGPVDVTRDAGTPRVIYDQPFGGVLPTFHRLDLSAERIWRYESGAVTTLHAGLINTYNRANLFALDLFTLRRIDQVPFMPTLGVKFEF